MGRKVTVVMPAYREKEEQIRQAIESILHQTMNDFEFIIVLDDPENVMLKELIEVYAKFDNRISFYVNERNSGCPFSKDRGVRLAKTEYVAIMDSDDISKPYRLERQIQKIEEDRLDLVAGYVTVINDAGTPLYNMDNLPLTHDKIIKKMKVNNCLPHPTWFFRKDMYLNLDGYANIQGCEDYDFLIRAIRNGYRLGVVNEILLEYRLSSQSVSRNNLYKQYLMMQFIQDKYFHHKLTYLNYEEYEKDKFDEKVAGKYALASIDFEQAIMAKSQKQYIKMIYLLIKIFFESFEYTKKIVRYVVQELR